MMKVWLGAAAVLLLGGSSAAYAACAGTPIGAIGNSQTIDFGADMVANAPDSISCSADTTIYVPANHYGVFKADSRGFVDLLDGHNAGLSLTGGAGSPGDSSLSEDGEFSDSVDFTGYYATGYVVADTTFSGTASIDVTGSADGSYATYDGIDFIVGYTTLDSQKDSIDEIGLQQLSLLTHLDANAGLLRGSDQPIEGENEVGVIGSFGSFMFGATGRYNLAEGFSLLGGASIVNLGVPGASATGLLGTGAIRYVDPSDASMRFFAEGGVEAAGLGLSFTRHYDNGTVTDYEATGSGMGLLGAGYLRAGILVTPDSSNEILLSASIKQSALGITSFVEDDPSSGPNLFAADYSGTSSTLTTVKTGVDWTTQLAADVDLTASGAIGAAWGSGASAAIFGIPGTVSGGPQSTVFAEYGLRLGWTPSPGTTVDGFVRGTTGTNIGTHAQIGAAYRMTF